jgi:hypothetical protein
LAVERTGLDMGKAVPAIIFFLLMFVPLASAGTGELLLENDRFVIRYTAGDDALAAELVRDSLRIREMVIADIGVDFTEKTEIRLSPTIEAFRETQPRGTWIPLWAAGVAYSESGGGRKRNPKSGIQTPDYHRSCPDLYRNDPAFWILLLSGGPGRRDRAWGSDY